MIRQKYRSFSAALPAVLFALLLAGCGETQQPQPAAPPPPAVTVAQPIKRNVIDQDEYVGRFVAVDSVEIRARVAGYLEKIHFKDGQMVKEGDLLFTIDKRPFQNAVAQARANLAQARANLAYAEADLLRGQQLVKDKTITEQTYEQRLQAQRTAIATVAANDASVKQAELDLEFTELRSPLTGRIGDRRVSPGNLVVGSSGGGTTTLLATIVSTDPIRFEFTFDETSYLRYERLALSGGKKAKKDDIAARGGSTVVRLKLIDEKDFIHVGRMDFLDNVIDRSTGTIRGRASFANSAGIFTPGMFARLQVPASPPYQALLIPDSAIGSEQARKFVYVVRPDNSVAQKYVELGQLSDGDRVIKSGVEADDRVIVEGLMRVRPGIKVDPQVGSALPPSAGSAKK
jgi:RND family efflux transporter MFP subunit